MWLSAPIALALALATGQAAPSHIEERMPDTVGPTTTTTTDRLETLAFRLMEQGQTAPRVAIFDIAWPANAAEAAALGGSGILQITALTDDPADCPLPASISSTAPKRCPSA